MTTYYAVCDAGGPISVELDGETEEQARAAFATLDLRMHIDGCSTDIEDAIGICGDGMSEVAFAEALESTGAVAVQDLSSVHNYHAGTAAHEAGGWTMWAMALDIMSPRGDIECAGKGPAEPKPMTAESKGARMRADITELLRARNTLLWVVSREEKRVEESIVTAAAGATYETRLWDCVAGVQDAAGKTIELAPDPARALAYIAERRDRAVYVLRDFHKWLADPFVLRAIRSLARSLQARQRGEMSAIVVLSPSAEIPPELAGHATVLEYPLPDRSEVAAILDGVLASIPADKITTPVNGTREAAIDAALGLSAEEAENCYARSLVTRKAIDPAVISNEKRRVVSRERVLTWYDPDPRGLDAIGGLDLLKPWLVQRKAALTPRARAFGLPAPKGAFLVGVPGCIAAGTRISYLRGKRKSSPGRTLSIEDFCEKFNGRGTFASQKWAEGLPTFLQSYDCETGRMVYNEVTAVVDSGVKPCVRVATDAGSVELTADHPILMADGAYKPAGDIAPGEAVTVRGAMSPRKGSGKQLSKAGRVIVEGLKFYPSGWDKLVTDRTSGKVYRYKRTTRARLVVEAEMNKLQYDEFVRILKEEPETAETLAYLPQDYDVHHMNEDPSDDQIGNLQVLTHEGHARDHGLSENFNVEHTRIAIVSRVEPIGDRRTFDVSMADPYNDFVVNGAIIVHNCGKSLAAKCLASAWGIPLLRLDLGALRSKYVGESEGNIRKALAVAEAVAPCVVWVDEIEKALAGSSGPQGDGGVAADALGALLSWMQERTAPVFVLATANDVRALPPELLRKGRFDEVWWVDLPTARERAEILSATLADFAARATNWAASGEGTPIDIPTVAGACVGFTGAEIAAIVPDALFAAFADGERQLTTADLLTAARSVVPLSKTAAGKLEDLRAWAKGRARPASTPEETTAGNVRALDL